MTSLKQKLFTFKQGLNIEQTQVDTIITEHIQLCDTYSEKEILGSLNRQLDSFKFYENVSPLLQDIDEDLSKNPLLYTLKDLYAKVSRKDQNWLYESALSSIIECINQPNDEDRKYKLMESLTMYEWIPEVKMFLAEMASNPQIKQNFTSNGGKIDDVYSVVLKLKEGYLTNIANKWFLLNNEGITQTLLENHIEDEIQLKKLRLLEQAIYEAEFNEDKIIFKISEELTVTFNTKDKKIYLNESEADKGTTLETLFNSPIIPFMGKAFYPVLAEAYNNLDKFMKIDTVKHVYNLANPTNECYVFNYEGKITQLRVERYAGNSNTSSYYSYDNAMPLIENVMQELGADLTFFFESLLSDEIKARIDIEKQEKVLLEKLTEIENSILAINNEGAELVKENKVVENLYNALLSKKHKISESLKTVKNQKNQLYTHSNINENKVEIAKDILTKAGLTDDDYSISLQGPTVIFTQSGKEKISQDAILRVDLIHSGIKLMNS